MRTTFTKKTDTVVMDDREMRLECLCQAVIALGTALPASAAVTLAREFADFVLGDDGTRQKPMPPSKND